MSKVGLVARYLIYDDDWFALFIGTEVQYHMNQTQTDTRPHVL